MTAPRRRPRRTVADPPGLDLKGTRQAAFDLLARKSWSRRDLVQRLGQRGAPADVARAVVDDLGARGYLDDEGFARWWAQARAQGRRIGSRRLRQELLAKGIARDLVDAAVAAAFSETPEIERAMQAGRRRLAALARADPGRLSSRLGAYLLRRGYPPSVASRVVKALVGGAEGSPDAFDEGVV